MRKWINSKLQYYGERYRSWRARREPETNLPFPYDNAYTLMAFQNNKAAAEPDFESYWNEELRIMYLRNTYNRAQLLGGLR